MPLCLMCCGVFFSLVNTQSRPPGVQMTHYSRMFSRRGFLKDDYLLVFIFEINTQT